MRKYILTGEIKKLGLHILHRIKAVKDFGDIHEGDLGGWIEYEYNLSQFGNCWIYDDAMVFDEAKIFGDAKIHDKVVIHEWAIVSQKAAVTDNATVSGHAIITGEALVSDEAKVYGRAYVSGNAFINEKVWIFDNAWVYGHANVCNNAIICGDAKIESDEDYVVFKNTWSSGRYFTWTRCNNMWKVGCFYGNGEELIKKAYKDSKITGECYEAIVKAQEIISKNLNL